MQNDAEFLRKFERKERKQSRSNFQRTNLADKRVSRVKTNTWGSFASVPALIASRENPCQGSKSDHELASESPILPLSDDQLHTSAHSDLVESNALRFAYPLACAWFFNEKTSGMKNRYDRRTIRVIGPILQSFNLLPRTSRIFCPKLQHFLSSKYI